MAASHHQVQQLSSVVPKIAMNDKEARALINAEFFEVYGDDAVRRANVAADKAARIERGRRGARR